MTDFIPMSVGNTLTYSNCFVLAGKNQKENKVTKRAMYVNARGQVELLYGGTQGKLAHYYQLTYDEAQKTYEDYVNGDYHVEGDESLRVSLWLENAMYGNLHIFVMDFDDYDETAPFFQAAYHLADKVTRSQSGGYHMFFGVNKETATPLFDSINLLASKQAKSFVCKVACTTLDGSNKVDFFCDNGRLLYEWEPWDNTIPLTDKTQAVYELIRDNFSLNRPKEFHSKSSNNHPKSQKYQKAIQLIENDDYSEQELITQMSEPQKEVFADLKTISSDCPQSKWISIGINIFHVFGEELGGTVFSYWSRPGHSYQPQSCANAWDYILELDDTNLNNRHWAEIMGLTLGLYDPKEKQKEKQETSESEPSEEELSSLFEQNFSDDEEPLPYEPLKFGTLTVLPQKDSERFLLPDKNNQSVTAYDVIGQLAGGSFKSYRKQIRLLNDKLQILPYSERCRAMFFFRKQYCMPPRLENSHEIAKFIKTALRYITNVQLSQNWNACLGACRTEETAASLLAYYGWAPDFRKELPKKENAFYKVLTEDNTRHYEIVEDDIVARFEAVEQESRMNFNVFKIVKSRKLSHQEKCVKLQAILQPRLWLHNGIKMGLNAEAYLECNRRIYEFTESLLKKNTFGSDSLFNCINTAQIDKSDPGFSWAKPRTFDISM